MSKTRCKLFCFGVMCDYMFHNLFISAGNYYYVSMIVMCCCHAVNKKRVKSKIHDTPPGDCVVQSQI